MIKDFAIAFSEMGLRKWQIITMGISFIIFPVTFFISSKNFDAEAVYGWMMEKPNKDKWTILNRKQIYTLGTENLLSIK